MGVIVERRRTPIVVLFALMAVRCIVSDVGLGLCFLFERLFGCLLERLVGWVCLGIWLCICLGGCVWAFVVVGVFWRLGVDHS